MRYLAIHITTEDGDYEYGTTVIAERLDEQQSDEAIADAVATSYWWGEDQLINIRRPGERVFSHNTDWRKVWADVARHLTPQEYAFMSHLLTNYTPDPLYVERIAQIK